MTLNKPSYLSKVKKYKLLVSKLNHDEAEALKHCAKKDFKLIENIPKNKQ